jgi:hypothetical protein
MTILGFTAEASLYKSTQRYAGRSSAAPAGNGVFAAAFPGCQSRCVNMCRSDPDLYEFNDCATACRCSCSGRKGCWQ